MAPLDHARSEVARVDLRAAAHRSERQVSVARAGVEHALAGRHQGKVGEQLGRGLELAQQRLVAVPVPGHPEAIRDGVVIHVPLGRAAQPKAEQRAP